MNLKNFNKVHLALIVGLALIQALTHFGVVYSDSKNYFKLTRYFEGRAEACIGALTARPLVPLLTVPLDLVLGLPVAYGTVNTILWAASAVLTYLITMKLFTCALSALYSALLLSTTWPMVLYGAASMTEAGGLFFTLLTTYVTLSLPAKKLSKTSLLLLGLLVGVGALAREVVLVALAFALIFLIYRRDYRSAKWFLIPSFAVVIMYQAYVHVNYGSNYLTHYAAGLQYTERRGLLSTWFDPVTIVKALALGHAPLAFLAAMLGFLAEGRREVLLTIYMITAPALGAFIAWPFHDLRIAIATYHATMPLAGHGLKVLAERLSSKPITSLLAPNTWSALLILTSLVIVNWLTYLVWGGRFSLPLDVYLFAPSSLRV
ncbi:MAG: hypothetical protein QXH61_07310 [Candidatus Nezhaarchaeales archaeon]